MAFELLSLSAAELRSGYLTRSFSPSDLIDAVARRIEQVEPLVHGFAALCLDRAQDEASLATREYLRGRDLPALLGIPFAAKDMLDSEGVTTAYGSRLFASHVPDQDAEAVRLARDAGAILVGKTVTHEFAWGMTLQGQPYGSSQNPWNLEYLPGGSSGGSAIALATRCVPLALGTDTGGSVRIPAAFCGVVGFKPSWDAVSTSGVFPLARSLDHVGPMATTPHDAAMLLDAIATDANAHRPSVRTERPSRDDFVRQLRFGAIESVNDARVSATVSQALYLATRALEDIGAARVDITMPWASGILDVYETVAFAEGYNAHHERQLFPMRAHEYGADVRARLVQGEQIPIASYLAAAEKRRALTREVMKMFDVVDILISPTAGIDVPCLDELERLKSSEYRTSLLSFTVLQNLCGLPACVVRTGFDENGLPVGTQLTGRPGADDLVLQVAQALVEATGAVQDQWPTLQRLSTVSGVQERAERSQR